MECPKCKKKILNDSEFCQFCGTTTVKEIKKSDAPINKGTNLWKIISIVLACILVGNVIFTIILWNTHKNTIEEKDRSLAYALDRCSKYTELQKEYSSLEDKYNDLKLTIYAYEEDVVFYTPSDSKNLYHDLGCYRLENSNFYIYTVEKAKSLGYKACPFCRTYEYNN